MIDVYFDSEKCLLTSNYLHLHPKEFLTPNYFLTGFLFLEKGFLPLEKGFFIFTSGVYAGPTPAGTSVRQALVFN